MGYATITGQLKDSDGTAWSNATWTAVPVSPSSKPVFPDGSPVPTTGGLLDATGHFSGEIPETIDIRPPGTTLTVTITSMTSAPPLTLTKVQIVSTAVDLGALLSPRLVSPRIKAAPIVYAYNAVEVTNPVHGNGYINTVENQSYIFMQNSWVKIGVGGIPEDVVRLAPTVNEGNLIVTGPVDLRGNVLSLNGAPTGNSSLLLYTSPPGGPNSIDSAGPNPATMGEIQFRSEGSDGTGLKVIAHLASTGALTTGIVRADGFFFGSNQTPAYGGLGWDGGGTTFLDGYPNGRLHVNQNAPGSTGDFVIYGNMSASGTKSFRVSHPLNPELLLIHACLEGPENGVYYRGEAELVDGRAIVELPDYFEALTFPDDRTVLLTQVDDGGELALLAASRVVDGKFSIRSNVSAALVSWEVKAVRRAGVDRLEVEQAKTGERSEGES